MSGDTSSILDEEPPVSEATPLDPISAKFEPYDILPVSDFSPKKSPSKIFEEYASEQYGAVRSRFKALTDEVTDLEYSRKPRRRKFATRTRALASYRDEEDPDLFSPKFDAEKIAEEKSEAKLSAYYPGQARDQLTMKRHGSRYRAADTANLAGEVENFDEDLERVVESAYAWRRNIKPVSATYFEHKLINDLSHEQGYRAVAPHLFTRGDYNHQYLNAALRTPSFWEHRLTQGKGYRS